MEIESSADQADAVRGAVVRLLEKNTEEAGYPYVRVPLVLKVEHDGQIIAGLVGYSLWNWFYVEVLAVDPEHRSAGLGRKLMERAEEIARQRGCRGIWVDTFSWQSPGFYRKLGYEPFGSLPNYPDEQERIFLRKLL